MRRTLRAALALAALGTLPEVAVAQRSEDATAPKTIVAVAQEAGQFKTLIAAVKAAGLLQTLEASGPFTVFAPTDAAFARLPAGTIEALLADKEKLTAILTYHVIAGRVTAGDIVAAGGARAMTVNGEELSVVLRDGKVYAGGAQVVTADIAASNGVIHVVDAVLLPASGPPAASR